MPKPGTYKKISKVFNEFDNEFSKRIGVMLDNGELMLAVSYTITGPVSRHPDLSQHFINALKVTKDMSKEDAMYYIDGLEDGSLVPVLSSGVDLVYPHGSEVRIPDYNYKIGELFFNS